MRSLKHPQLGPLHSPWSPEIHFSPGQYGPHTPKGKLLLGHELARVLQQRAGSVSDPFGVVVAGLQDHALELEADRLGRIDAPHQVAQTMHPGYGFRMSGLSWRCNPLMERRA